MCSNESDRGTAESVDSEPDAVGAEPSSRAIGSTITMPPHLGQGKICPVSSGWRTLSLTWQVVHEIKKASTQTPSLWKRDFRQGRKRPAAEPRRFPYFNPTVTHSAMNSDGSL